MKTSHTKIPPHYIESYRQRETPLYLPYNSLKIERLLKCYNYEDYCAHMS